MLQFDHGREARDVNALINATVAPACVRDDA
jgi:hypothetical protein